jgi:hypothetical protein
MGWPLAQKSYLAKNSPQVNSLKTGIKISGALVTLFRGVGLGFKPNNPLNVESKEIPIV